jgi:hypothetical protein
MSVLVVLVEVGESCDVVSAGMVDVNMALSESDGASVVVIISGTARNKE